MDQLVKSVRSSVGVLAVLAALGVGSAARADMMENLAKTTPQQRAEIQTAYMKSKLGLSEEETAKVAAVNLEYAQKAEPVIKGSEGGFSKMRQMREIQTAKDGALKGVLTPAQYDAYDAARDDMKEKFEAAIQKKLAGGS